MERDQRLAELVDLIASQQALLVLGAGFSIAAQFDSWPRLLRELAKRATALAPGFVAREEPIPPADFLAYAQEISDSLGPDEFNRALHQRLYLSRESDVRDRLIPFHRQLVGLPFQGILTTNYDIVAEVAYKDAHGGASIPKSVTIWHPPDTSQVAPSIRALSERRPHSALEHVIHLHGVVTQPSSIVLTERSYLDAYGFPSNISDNTDLVPPDIATALALEPHLRRTLTIAELRARANWSQRAPRPLYMLTAGLMATRRLIFVGFSMDDPYLARVLRDVSSATWTFGTSAHYALLPIYAQNASAQLDRAKQLKSEYGVETIFYRADGQPEAHDELYRLVDRISREVQSKTSPPSSPAPSPDSSAPPATGASQSTSDWVAKTNKFALTRRVRHED